MSNTQFGDPNFQDTRNFTPNRPAPLDNNNNFNSPVPRQFNESPERNPNDPSNTLPVDMLASRPEEEEEELEELIYRTDQLVEMKRSDYMAPIEITARQGQYMVLFKYKRHLRLNN